MVLDAGNPVEALRLRPDRLVVVSKGRVVAERHRNDSRLTLDVGMRFSYYAPYVNILGHPTGRLLLAREGYPIDHVKIIDACAQHKVAIELNANPNRLDLDYTWLPYALSKGVKIAVNPDAHSCEGINDIRYGLYSARKGAVPFYMCLNTMQRDEFEKWIKKRKISRQ